MKTHNKLFILLLSAVLVGIGGCSDEEKDPVLEKTPELKIGNDILKVKIGAENKLVVNVTQGGGEYNAFSLNDDIAKVETISEGISIEGMKNGKTSIIVSDKNGYYRKLPISVFTTDKIVLSAEKIELTTPLGHAGTAKAKIKLGNGEYQVASDNKAVKVEIKNDEEIIISGTSKKEEVKAIVTITDNTGITTSLNVKVISTMEPYSAKELEEIKKNSKIRYMVAGDDTDTQYSAQNINKVENERQIFGWDYYSGWLYFRISFKGDRAVGEKQEGLLERKFYGSDWDSVEEKESVKLTIIKNDETNLWGVFSYVKDEKLNYGHFCDKVKTK